jgi:hypothetical protein
MTIPEMTANIANRLPGSLGHLGGLRKTIHNFGTLSVDRQHGQVKAGGLQKIAPLDHLSFTQAACAALERLPVV